MLVNNGRNFATYLYGHRLLKYDVKKWVICKPSVLYVSNETKISIDEAIR
jgi:hypothetical protein